MSQYYKTDLGIESLKQRSMNLNARQRRLLLLIGTDDFDLLDEQFKHRIAPPEVLSQLIDMGLITPSIQHPIETPEPTTLLDTEIKTNLPLQTTNSIQEKLAEPITTTTITPVSSSITHTHSTVTELQHDIDLTLEELNFEQVKHLMAQLLQQNCGLMGKQLMNRILNSHDLRSLKLCQMQWITELQESRIRPHQLNHCLKQINFSLQKLNAS
ncbi:hypothetical protein B9T24_01345 [Acinetobacter sp. ANC 4654]|uniref:hypothetical protein n=1 Tax=Acinetobacter sp. ANC 4654 TaxID=1977872 RepID=UPI000A32B5AF|nr:hypothetical protein [Acinetobacter sp. ANC 4654]OTG98044.1 hypothetical protein B9T24_01345 [Acinetobacter sp. ANC 4654]